MLNALSDWFVKTAYWHRWDRVLERMGGDFKHSIDVSVEPMNDYPGDWDMLKQVNIRKHMTYEPPKNFKHDFPDEILHRLIKHVGPDMAWFIIEYPILKSLKPGALDRMDTWNQMGGGIPFILITKEPFKFKFLLDEWDRQLQLNSEAGRRARRLQYYTELSKIMDPTVDTIIVDAHSGMEPGIYHTHSLGCLGLNARIDKGVFEAGPFTPTLKLREQTLKDLVLFKPNHHESAVDVVLYTLKF